MYTFRCPLYVTPPPFSSIFLVAHCSFLYIKYSLPVPVFQRRVTSDRGMRPIQGPQLSVGHMRGPFWLAYAYTSLHAIRNTVFIIRKCNLHAYCVT